MASVTAIMQVLMSKYGDGEGVLNGVPKEELLSVLTRSGMGNEKKGKRKRKDPSAPKRAMSGDMLWLNKNREEIRER